MSVLAPSDRHQWWAPDTRTCFYCGGIVSLQDPSVMWKGADGHGLILHPDCTSGFATHLSKDARQAIEEASRWQTSCTEHVDPSDWVLCPRRNTPSYFDWLLAQDAEQLGGLVRPRLGRAQDGIETPDDRLVAILVGTVLGLRETGVSA
jgi:hypothetical protein